MKVGALFFILIILGVAYLIFISSVFKIKSFSLNPDGADCINSDEVKKLAAVSGANFFLLDLNQIEKKIKDKFFCVSAVNLKKSFPDKVALELKARKAVFNLIPFEASSSANATSSGFLVDGEGVIFERATDQTNLQPVLFKGETLLVGKRLQNDLVGKVMRILESLKRLGFDLNNAKVYSIDNFSVGLKPQLIFKLNETLDRQLASLQLIINQARMDTKEVEFIDLRFDKPVVRYAQKK